MAVTIADWTFLRNAMLSLDKRVKNGAVVVGVDPSTIWDLPANILEAAAARAYLEGVYTRLQEVAQAVDDVASSPLERARDIGHEVGMKAAAAAKRASQIARDVANDMADRFDNLQTSLMKGGENLATGLGVGAGVVIVIGLLLAREFFGKGR
jgi:ElaB/YqjD/DUF883 family membrane-anchored ribosome-binding protein